APASYLLVMVSSLLHWSDVFRRLHARLHLAHPPSCGRNQLLCPVQSSHQCSGAAAFRRLDPPLATPVLVFRTSRGVCRHCARHGDYFSCLDYQHAQAAAKPSSGGLLHGSLGGSELHGVRAPHVRQRDESDFIVGVLLPHSHYHHPFHHPGADLAGQPLRREVTHYVGFAL